MQIIDEILRMTKLQAKTKTTYMPIPGVVAPPISVQSTDYTPEEQTNIDVLLKEKDRYQDLLAFHLLGEDGPSWFTRAELLLKQGGEIGVGLGGGMAGGAGATAVSGPAAPVAGPAGAAAGYIGSVWAYRELLGDEYKDRLDKLKAAYPRQSFVTDLAPLLIVAAQARTIVGNIQTIIRESGKRALVGKAFADLTGDIGGSAIASFATGTPYSPNATDAIFSLLGVDPNKRLSLLKQQEEGYNLYGVLRKAANIDGEYAAFDGTLTHAHTTSRIDNVDPTLLPSLMSYAKFRKSVIFTLFNSMDQVPDTIKNAKNPYEALLRYVEQPEIAKAIMSLMKPEVRSPAGILLPNTINQQLKEGIDRKQLIEILDILGTRVFDTTQGRRGNARIIPDDPIKLLDTIKEQIRSGNGPIKDAELGAIFDGLSDQWKIRALGDDFTWTNPPAAQLGYNQLSETQKKLLDLGDEPGKSTYADRAKSNSRTTGTQGRIENAAFELIDGKDGKKWKKVKATSRTPQRRSLRPLYEPRSIGGNIKDMLKDFFGLNGPPPLKTNSVFYKDVVKAAKATKSEDISPKTFSDMFFGAVRGEPHEIATNVSNFAKLFGLPVSNVVPKGLEIFANKALSGVKDAFGWWREGTGQMFVMENSPFGMATLMHELVHSMVHRFGKSAYSNLQSVIKTKMPKIIEYMKKNPSLYGSYGTKDIAGGMYYVINKLLGTRIDKESMMAQLSGPLNPVDIGNLDLETATQLPIDFELSNGIVVPTYLTNALNLKRPPPLPLMLNDQGIKYYDDVGKLMDMYDADTMNLEDIKKQYTSLYVSQLDPLEFADFPDGATLMKNALADIEKNTSAEFDNYVNWGREEFITQTIQNLPRLDANGLELLSEILSEGLVQNGSAVFEKNVLYDRLRRYINEYRDSADSNPNVSQEIKDYYRTGEQLPPSLPQTRARGGMIYASNGSLIDFSPRGTDTVPAMLTPGEFVINKAATSKHLPLLRSINRGETIYRQKGSDEPEGMSGPTIAQRQAEKRMYQLMEMPRHGHTLTEIEQQELAKLRADYAKRPDVIAKRQSRSDELAVDRILRKRKADRTPEENQILDRWNKEMDAKVPNRAYRRNPQNRGKEGKTIYYNVGGSVNFQSIGTDVIPAMLTPGEFVVNREATKKNYSLLKQINDGSYYSRGDIVKKFNLGGYVKPSYLRTGGEPSLSGILPQNNSFDFASFMQQLIGQLSTIVSSSIRDIANSNQQNNTRDIDNRSNGVSINIESQVLDRISDFTNRLRSVADTLAGLSAIPSDIRITAKHDINIVINGDSVLNRLNPEIQSIVMQELRRGFQNLIDLNSPVASDKLNNPFDIA
jgi:hypothetical protein